MITLTGRASGKQTDREGWRGGENGGGGGAAFQACKVERALGLDGGDDCKGREAPSATELYTQKCLRWFMSCYVYVSFTKI